jgi:hypothetical protein
LIRSVPQAGGTRGTVRRTRVATALWLGMLIGLIGVPVANVVLGPDAQAFIPAADRTLTEIARVNRVSGRNKALQLDVTMRVGDRAPIAKGQLISHPSGLARLELRGFNGRVDRYLLSGQELLGAKDGRRLIRPQPLLQPLFFLQPSSSATLRAALESFDILSDTMGLAPCGDQDCFVIGDPRLAAPLADHNAYANTALSPVLGDPLEADSDYGLAETRGSGVDRLAGPELSGAMGPQLPRLWVDTEDLQVRRIDRADGVFTIFGPIVSFDKLMHPAWFEVHEPGEEAIRFQVDRVVQVNAPATAFSQKWLLAPIATDPLPNESRSVRPSASPRAPGTRAPTQ